MIRKFSTNYHSYEVQCSINKLIHEQLMNIPERVGYEQLISFWSQVYS